MDFLDTMMAIDKLVNECIRKIEMDVFQLLDKGADGHNPVVEDLKADIDVMKELKDRFTDLYLN